MIKFLTQYRFLLGITCIFSVMMVVINFLPWGEQHYTYLASSFLSGKTYFLEQPPGNAWMDTIAFKGQYYWPLGPFPAVVLVPFVWLFKSTFNQGLLSPFLALGVFVLVFKIARKIGYMFMDSWYFAFAFCFSTLFIGVSFQPFGWYFAHLINTLLLWVALYEFLHKRRWFIIGIAMGAVFATRTTSGLGSLFFLGEIFVLYKGKRRIKNMFSLVIPIVIFLAFLGWYNFIRFGSFFETGYGLQQILIPSLTKAREYGLFCLTHLPGNLYHFLLAGPLPIFSDDLSHVLKFPFIKADPWGMSIFITSPWFIYLFFLKNNELVSKLLILTSIVIAMPIFAYCGIGFQQYGYRYSLDFLPFLFLLLIRNYHIQCGSLSIRFRKIIIISSLFNLFLFLTFIARF